MEGRTLGAYCGEGFEWIRVTNCAFPGRGNRVRAGASFEFVNIMERLEKSARICWEDGCFEVSPQS